MINKIVINSNDLKYNFQYFRQICEKSTEIIAVIKANAYGHGLIEAGRIFLESGASALAVASLEEAIEVRLARINCPIIVISYIDPEDFRKAITYDISISIFDFESVFKLSMEAKKANKTARVHLKINTGMNRFGFDPDQFFKYIPHILKLKNVKIEGIYSHFAEASDRRFSQDQLKKMQNILFYFHQNKINLPIVHMSATDSTLNEPEAHFDAVRIGLGLYGYSDSNIASGKLKPALKLESKIAQIREVKSGETIGYQRTYKTDKNSKIATIPIGYSDGYPRELSNKGEVLISEKRAKIVGRICMNILMADVTGIGCSVGDEVVLIGRQGNASLYADEVAKIADTNTHEILSRLSSLIKRNYI